MKHYVNGTPLNPYSLRIGLFNVRCDNTGFDFFVLFCLTEIGVCWDDFLEAILINEHLLVMTPALLCWSRWDDFWHLQKNLFWFSCELCQHFFPMFANKDNIFLLLILCPLSFAPFIIWNLLLHFLRWNIGIVIWHWKIEGVEK